MSILIAAAQDARVAGLPATYLVADKADYNWRTAPWRHYVSFADFYQRECAATWGEWAELHAKYQKPTAEDEP